MEPCKKCPQAIKAHCLTLNRRFTGNGSILCGAMEHKVNGKKPLKEKQLTQPHENFSRDYKDVLNEAQDHRVTRGQIESMNPGPMKIVAACLFFNIGPGELAKVNIPRSKQGVYNWIKRFMEEMA